MRDSMLRKGYFPAEMPPLFNTGTLADCIHNNKNKLIDEFNDATAKWTQPAHHNLSRVGGLRRRLGIPNPINYYRLSNAFDIHKELLFSKWDSSPYSKTLPVRPELTSRAIAPNYSDRAIPRIKARLGSRYLLVADISQFYPSIYTHSVSWALHGKAVAKSKIKDTHLAGNLIDKELQASHYGQTKGVSIGPDSSLGVAELILQDIDQKLSKNCKPNGGVRFIDDMEYGFSTMADAESASSVLESLLSEYELQLNVNKTRIIELPTNIESHYVSKLRSMIPSIGVQTNSQWIDYFNQAFLLAKKNPSDGVLRYAVSCLQGTRVDAKQWELVQSLLWQCLVSDPGVMRFVIDVLWINIHAGNGTVKLDNNMAAKSVGELIVKSAPVGHASEVLWSIWASLLFKVKISNEAIDACMNVNDPFVAVAAMVAKEQGLVEKELKSAVWCDWFTENSFYESGWLFVYESYVNNWYTEEVANAGVKSNKVCKFLKQAHVTFIDRSAINSYIPKRLASLTAGSGGAGY